MFEINHIVFVRSKKSKCRTVAQSERTSVKSSMSFKEWI